jgi:hypothetical protein
MIQEMSVLRWPLVFALVLACVACDLGNGTGSVSGSLYLRGCTHDYDYGAAAAPADYDMRPSYFVGDPINALQSSRPLHPVNKVAVRVQSDGNRIEEADTLQVRVADDALVVETLGMATAIGPFSNVRASLQLSETCPDAEVGAELDGTMTFTSFGGRKTATDGIQFGDRISASFDFDVIDRRAITLGGVGGVPTTPAAGGHISGSFDFVVRQGKAAQAY